SLRRPPAPPPPALSPPAPPPPATPAANGNTRPRPVPRRLRTQECNHGRALLGCTEAAERNDLLRAGPPLGRHVVGHRRHDRARRDDVAGNRASTELAGDAPREANQPGLGRRVVGLSRCAMVP